MSEAAWKWVDIGIDDEVALVSSDYDKETNPDAIILSLGWVSLGDGSRGRDPTPENGKIIEAAPVLLDACKRGVQYLEQLRIVASAVHYDVGLEDIIGDMKAAIEKAGGYIDT